VLDGHFVSPFLHYFSLQQIKSITVASFITYQAIRCFVQKTVVDGLIKPFYFMGRGVLILAETGKPEASAIAMILVPFPRFVFPTARAPSGSIVHL
jgi:hypothetical protein